MAEVARRAIARWRGNLAQGEGVISSGSGVIDETPYTAPARFEAPVTKTTNPEEFLASALASCYTMALCNELSKQGFTGVEAQTSVTCLMDVQASGAVIRALQIQTRGKADGIDAETFRSIAADTEANGCPIAHAFHGGSVKIELDAALL